MEHIEQKILDLPLKAKWYLMQESGEKPEEYREITPYWCKRLLGTDRPSIAQLHRKISCNSKGYTHVKFRYGYTKRTFTHKIESITIGYGKPEWGAPKDKKVFIIKHHKESKVWES